MRIKKRFALLFSAGLIILAGVLSLADLSWMALAVRNIGWGGYFLLLIVNFPTLLFSGLAWKLIFDRMAGPGMPFRDYVLIKQAANSVNAVTPGFILGEPVRVYLTKGGAGVEARSASVILDRYLETVGQTAFLAAALAAGILSRAVPAAFLWPLTAVLLAAGLFLHGLGRALMGREGALSPRWLNSGVARRFLGKHHEAFHRARALMADFSVNRKSALLAAVAVNILKMSWVALFLHAALVLMGEPSSFLKASLFVSLGSLISVIPIPETVGTEEAAYAGLAALLGSRPEAGIALALLHKAVRWIWLIGGFLVGAGGGLAKAAAKAEPGTVKSP